MLYMLNRPKMICNFTIHNAEKSTKAFLKSCLTNKFIALQFPKDGNFQGGWVSLARYYGVKRYYICLEAQAPREEQDFTSKDIYNVYI